MKSGSSASASPWTATACAGRSASPTLPTPAQVGPDWMELRQAWRPAAEANFNRGWARIRWDPAGLHYDVVFVQAGATNRATRLNERTWELGDIAEFFLQETAGGRYLELHVTPENQRLQLLWPPDGLTRFRAGQVPLEKYLVADPQWVSSEVTVQPGHWSVRAYIPFRCLGLPPGAQLSGLRTAVCRYDRSHGAEILSSTAALTEPNYHRVAEWAELRLGR